MKVTVINGSLSLNEQSYYVKCVCNKHPDVDIEEIVLDAGGEGIQYQAAVHRRVLAKQGGTVIGDPMTWNNAKRAEYVETIPNSIDGEWL